MRVHSSDVRSPILPESLASIASATAASGPQLVSAPQNGIPIRSGNRTRYSARGHPSAKLALRGCSSVRLPRSRRTAAMPETTSWMPPFRFVDQCTQSRPAPLLSSCFPETFLDSDLEAFPALVFRFVARAFRCFPERSSVLGVADFSLFVRESDESHNSSFWGLFSPSHRCLRYE